MLRCRCFRTACLVVLMLFGSVLEASTSSAPSTMRGAVVFMNYCSGCHGMRYLSWSRMKADLHLTPHSTVHLSDRLLLSPIDFAKTWPQIAMATEDAQAWFGKPPPDLSLVHAQRGSAWLTAYLQGFYLDHSRFFGVSNILLPQVRMPNVLESLQEDLSQQDFAMVVADIVGFLEYAADPSVLMRWRLGLGVVGFFVLFALLFWRRMVR